MTDWLKKSAEWLSKERHKKLTQDVVIRIPGSVGVPLLATVPSCQTETMMNGVKIQTQYYDFIFRNQDLKDKGIVLCRGLLIEWENKVYEIAFDKKLLFYPSDPFDIDMTIQTVFKGDKNCESCKLG